MVKLDIKPNTYYDSVTLMIISKDLKKLDGVEEALVGMGTDLNRELAHNLGINSPEFETVTPNDFFVAVKCDSDEVMAAALAKVEEMLNKKKENSAMNYYPPTLSSALKMDDQLNMAVISVPGKYAAEVAQSCLDKDINVMLFSDNVTIDEEKRLKECAASKGLLMMGPDCGTAIINNVPLAFANVVKPGDIGIVGASGTGTQEVSSLIDQFGGGCSQVLGTGGRDLKLEIGGIMMTLGLDALINDPMTKVITLISKPPAEEIADKILKQAAGAGKPVVVCFIGGDPAQVEKYGLTAACSLEDTARKAVAFSKGEKPVDFTGFTAPEAEIDKLAADEAAKFASTQKYIRGLYTGGTLCDESMKLLTKDLGGIHSNIPLSPEFKLADVNKSVENTCLDYGDDDFTRGRPHPMIDPSLRAERVVAESLDPSTAVILADCVIGYGSHPNPAEDLCDAIKKAKANAEKDGRYISAVVAVCGTEGDPQCLSKTQQQLREAGAIVMPSNAQAARFSEKILANIK